MENRDSWRWLDPGPQGPYENAAMMGVTTDDLLSAVREALAAARPD
jgi:hypothetical protein